jgi:Ca-activated chloride channel family protein
MRFMWPGFLWGLLLIPVAVLAYLGLHRRRLRQATRFGNPALWPNLVPRNPGGRRHIPALLLLLALTALLVGLARPQKVDQVPREEGTVVLTMDSSVSMLATDISPTRLAAAKTAADTLISQLPPRYRMALVTFSGVSVTRSLPTTDRDEIRAALESVTAEGGTAIGEGIRRALEVGGARPPVGTGPPAQPAPPQEDQPPLAILLLSDGYSTEGLPPLEAAQVARDLEVPVFTVAVGTQDGLGPDGRPAPPDEATLRQVAETTGGQFFTAPTSDDLQAVYANLGSKVSTEEKLSELTAWTLGGALLMFLAGGALALVWFNRFP